MMKTKTMWSEREDIYINGEREILIKASFDKIH